MSRHAKRIIVQFMAACRGKSTTDKLDDVMEEKHMATLPVAGNEVSLNRFHNILAGMAKEDTQQQTRKKSRRHPKLRRLKQSPNCLRSQFLIPLPQLSLCKDTSL